MRNYLSFGGGVNSVAMHLYLLEHGKEHGIGDFEAVFVDHGTDWPETYEYLNMFQDRLKKRGHKPVTVLKPSVRIGKGINAADFDDVYKYAHEAKTFPSRVPQVVYEQI